MGILRYRPIAPHHREGDVKGKKRRRRKTKGALRTTQRIYSSFVYCVLFFVLALIGATFRYSKSNEIKASEESQRSKQHDAQNLRVKTMDKLVTNTRKDMEQETKYDIPS